MIENLKLYEPGYTLKENEYLLKIRQNENGKTPTGFIAKLNKNGSLLKSFDDWGINYWEKPIPEPLDIYVIEETFKEGWKLESWRFGMSQNWATVIHPDGYTLEIYLSQFLDIVKENTIVNGVIQGSFKWEKKHLVKFTHKFDDSIVDRVLEPLKELKETALSVPTADSEKLLEKLVLYSNHLAGKLNEMHLYMNYIAKNLDNSIQHNDHIVENVIDLKNYSNYLAKSTQQGISYTEHIAGKVDESIRYAEHIAGKVDKSIGYTEHIAGKVDESIRYAEHIAGKVDESIRYTEHVAKGADDAIEYGK